MAAMLPLAIGGCAVFQPEPDGTFTVFMPEHEFVEGLTVDVVDRTGTVQAVVMAEGNFQEGIVAARDDPAVLVVTWVGGICDVRTRLSLEPTLDMMRISEATETRLGACEAAGILRSIAIRFDPPLAPGFAEFAPD
jgi:hypothetical protein